MKELRPNTQISHRAGTLPLYGHVIKLVRKALFSTHFLLPKFVWFLSIVTHILEPPLVRIIIILNLKSVRFTLDC